MLSVSVEQNRIRFGERLAVSFHRTLRVPDNGKVYPLPAGLGLFPLVQMECAGRPAHAVPTYRREAMWIGFSGAAWKPNAVKVIVGGINAVSGLPDDGAELGKSQDYLVCPLQPWLDGFNAGDGTIRQFVAMPLGEGYAIEAGHGLPERGGLVIVAFEPKPGRFPDEPPAAPRGPQRFAAPRPEKVEEMAFGAGGSIRQKLYPDPHGRDAWDRANCGSAAVTILDSHRFAELTGLPPPPTPVDAACYAAAGLPWFDIYDEEASTLQPAGGGPRSTILERDRERGQTTQERPPEIGRGGVVTLRGPLSVRRRTDGPEDGDTPS
jgi:hypothetical protein